MKRRVTELTKLRRRAGRAVNKMDMADCVRWLEGYCDVGYTIDNVHVRELTGGYNSQGINSYVKHKVYERWKRLVRRG